MEDLKDGRSKEMIKKSYKGLERAIAVGSAKVDRLNEAIENDQWDDFLNKYSDLWEKTKECLREQGLDPDEVLKQAGKVIDSWNKHPYTIDPDELVFMEEDEV